MFNVGDKVRVKDSCTDWTAPNRETVVLGIYNDGLLMVFRPQEYSGYPRTMNGINHPETWNLLAADLELITPTKIVPAYNTGCKICKKPARKIGKTLLCSNTKCKSRHAFKKSFKVPYYKAPKDVDADGFVICRVCKGKALNVANLPNSACGPSYLASCRSGHVEERTWLDGQKLSYAANDSVYVYRDLQRGFESAPIS